MAPDVHRKRTVHAKGITSTSHKVTFTHASLRKFHATVLLGAPPAEAMNELLDKNAKHYTDKDKELLWHKLHMGDEAPYEVKIVMEEHCKVANCARVVKHTN